MRTKVNVAIITFLMTMICIVIYLNFSKSDSWKSYSFERKYSNPKNFKFEKEASKMSNDNYLMFIDSDTLIAESEPLEDKDIYAFFFKDKNLKNITHFTAKIPEGSNRLLCNLNEIYFTNKFQLYKYDTKSRTNQLIGIPNFKIISLRTIDFDNKIYLFFGEQKTNNEFITGFYIYNLKNKTIKISKEISKSSDSKTTINTLEYSGNYKVSKEDNTIIYYCDKYSKIYVFDNMAKYIKTITTKDNVPLPKIISNENGINFYSRDGTYNTNMGVIIKNDKLLVFSASNNNKFKITIDQYSIEQNKYVKTYLVDFKNYRSNDLRNAFLFQNKLVLVTEFNYASFILEI